MTFESICELVLPFVSVGFLLGCIPMIFGIGVRGFIHIIKQI